MAKVKNPLFSIGASGTIAGMLTINQSNTQPTARRTPRGYTAPTAPQTFMRNQFRQAAVAWHGLDPTERAEWRALAAPRATTAFAKYCLEWMAQGSTLATPPLVPMA